MGKFSRTWDLVKQSFVILRSDKQLMLFPVPIAAIKRSSKLFRDTWSEKVIGGLSFSLVPWC